MTRTVPLQSRHLAYIGIGSNKGDRLSLCREAVRRLKSEGEVWVKCVSSLYETAPMLLADQDWFYNAVIEVETRFTPGRLLRHSQEIEEQLGKRILIPKGPRTIDLDLLFYDQEILDEGDLVVPHPSIALRRFVLKPLSEIAPDFIHPVLRQDIQTLLKSLRVGDRLQVIKRKEIGWERATH